MRIAANGIALEVEDHGSPAGEPLLLIMGLGMQLVAWPDGFVASLVECGFRVIRFDNRDIGLSQSFDAAGVPNLAFDSIRYAVGWKRRLDGRHDRAAPRRSPSASPEELDADDDDERCAAPARPLA